MEHLEKAFKVDGLEVLELLGQGGGSKVFKARQLKLDRIVALKVLNLDSCGPNSLSRFKNEAKLCSSLDHPNMARVLSYGIADDGSSPYMVMEYCPGKTLAEYLHSSDSFSGHQISELILQILDVLGYAHSNKIVHRDLKPQNIILQQKDSGGFHVKLLDFGIARLVEPDATTAAAGITKTNSIVGTPVYMSPEQCLGRPADERSDLYSLAAILYELFYKHPVLEASTELELLYKKSHEDVQIDRSEKSLSHLGKAMLDLLESALSRNPADRPQNAAEFRMKFVKAMGEMQAISAKNLSELLQAPVQSSKPSGAISLVLLAGLAIAILVFAMQMRNSTKKDLTVPAKGAKPSSVASLSCTHDLAEAEKFDNAGNYTEAARILTAALNKANSPESKVEVLKALAMVVCRFSIPDAEKYWCKAEAIIEKQSVSPRLAASVYDLHSHLYYNNNRKLPLVHELMKKAMDQVKNSDSPQTLLTILLDQKSILIFEKKYAEAANVLDQMSALEETGFGKYAEGAVHPRIEAITCRYYGDRKKIENEITSVAREIEESDQIPSDMKMDDLSVCAAFLLNNDSLDAADAILQKARKLSVQREETEMHLAETILFLACQKKDDALFSEYASKLAKMKSPLMWLEVNDMCQRYAQKYPEKTRQLLETVVANWDSSIADLRRPAIAVLADLSILERQQKRLPEAKMHFRQLIELCESCGATNLQIYSRAKTELAQLEQKN